MTAGLGNRKLDAKRFVLATHNDGKLREFRALMAPFAMEIVSAGELELMEPVEDGDSFEANAFTKAFAAAQATGEPALSDDSGLCVDALDGQPGIHTADWAEKPDGSGRDFDLAMDKVEKALADIGLTPDNEAARRGYFCAVLCLAWPDGHAEYFRGEAHGCLVWPGRGDQGFGYDPVFKPDGQTRTFGEMEAGEKHGWHPDTGGEGLSHRARAFAKFARAKLVR